MEFRILGPLEVVDDGRPIDVGAAKQRALLAVLLLHSNRVVSRDALIEALWGERAPETAQKALQVYVSSLRKALGRERIRTRAPGYELHVGPGELDVERVQQLVADGRLDDALALWRGQPLADFAYEPFAQPEIARLEELRLSSLEERIERELAQGLHGALVGQLEALVREHPLRERLRAQLMLALYRSGRQAEALEVYRAGRAVLAEELGLDPGADLRELERRILAQDASLVLPTPGDPGAPAPEAASAVDQEPPRASTPHEVRKTVTVVVSAVDTSGTPVDPETKRRLVARAHDELVPILEGHGATVERSIAGTITALFGIPAVHEDDALRAVRAAEDMKGRLDSLAPELERRWSTALALRAGIATGEVLTGGEEGERGLIAAGTPVEHAHALHARATSGETFLDERTLRLVREAVDVAAADGHIRLLGLRATPTGYAVELRSPMIGRERERRRLRDAFDQACADRACQLFTILGAPGVGKSRLVQEFADDLGEEALVARGRCLPYGEGITYWPVVEAVRDAAGLAESESPGEALAVITGLVADEEEAERVAQRVGEVLGLVEEMGGAEETFWGVRSFFEALARRRPLLLVFDDIHWGEPTFLDLVDHLADWVRDVPVLLVCVARPDLLDARPHWGGGKLNATSALLQPLSESESEKLVVSLAAGSDLAEPEQRRIVDAAGGNPLFVEEMLALVLEEGADGSTPALPPTIQALLAARLDRLGETERVAIEAAAVEGKLFHETSVADLLGISTGEVRERLLTLVRRELVRPDRAVFAGERAYGFRHLLIRDAAYDSIPKETRALLHERHAAWLERRAGDRELEFEEILGYHLEQAYKYRSELGAPDEHAYELAHRAGGRLAIAGRRALTRHDVPAAINLLSRAAALLPKDDPSRVHLVPTVRAVQGLGDRLGWAQAVLEEALVSADPLLAAHARVQQALLDLFTRSTVDVDELVAVAEEALAVFDRFDDHLGRARAWRLLQQARYLGRDAAASPQAAERALVHARAADDWLEEMETITWLGVALFMGATPVAEAAVQVESLIARTRGVRAVGAPLLSALAALRAMEDRVEEARSLLGQARDVVDDLGFPYQLAVVPFYVGQVERLAGAPDLAEQALRASLQPLEEMRETSTYCSIVATLAQVVYEQGRSDEAEQLTHVSERASRLNDVHAQIVWRSVRAKSLARRGQYEIAQRLAREAIAFAEAGDFFNAHADALLDLAEIMTIAGRTSECVPAIERAIELFDAKGNLVSGRRARERLRAVG